MSDFTIEDLRLPCDDHSYAAYDAHRYHNDKYTKKGKCIYEGIICDEDGHWLNCPGGRVPTRAELIDMLDLGLERGPDTFKMYHGRTLMYTVQIHPDNEWVWEPFPTELPMWTQIQIKRSWIEKDAALGDDE